MAIKMDLDFNMHKAKNYIITKSSHQITDQFLIFPKDMKYIFNKLTAFQLLLKVKRRCQIYKMFTV